jgi:hypothetical protein
MAYFPHFPDMRSAIATHDGSKVRSLNDDAFHRDRGRFAAADAERGDAAFQIMRFERVQQRDDQAGAGGADGMAERAGAAIDVEFLAGNSEIALCRHRHHRERLVDLEQVDIADAPADLVEQLADRRDRRGGEPLRFLAVGGVALDLGQAGRPSRSASERRPESTPRRRRHSPMKPPA